MRWLSSSHASFTALIALACGGDGGSGSSGTEVGTKDFQISGMDEMSSLHSLVVFLVLSALALACSGIKVDSDYDPSADFSQLRTWAWLPQAGQPDDSGPDNALLDSRIRAAVKSELDAKGYTLSTSGTPDFQVAYHLSVAGKLEVDTLYRRHRGTGLRIGGGRVGWDYARTHVREYDEGTLLLGVLEPGSGALLWWGSGVAIMREGDTHETRMQHINSALKKILERFPPGDRGLKRSSDRAR
jgi:hypothetical protein